MYTSSIDIYIIDPVSFTLAHLLVLIFFSESLSIFYIQGQAICI